MTNPKATVPTVAADPPPAPLDLSRFKVWLSSNPLRQMRAKGINQTTVAHLCSVTPKTVQSWERGFGRPTDQQFHVLGPDIKERWEKWESERPTL